MYVLSYVLVYILENHIFFPYTEECNFKCEETCALRSRSEELCKPVIGDVRIKMCKEKSHPN